MLAAAEGLFADLDCINRALSLPDIERWLRETPLGLDDVREALVFRPDRYTRNLLHAGPGYQALVICWRNGQRSPIHDHLGSNCGVKVLRGEATETTFATAPNGMLVPVGTRTLPEGHTCASADSDVHQISNLQSDALDLVTLHIYSPPLMRMGVYSLDHSEVRLWDDPINDRFIFGHGI